MFAATSFLCNILAEVSVEATLQHRRWALPGHTVGLIITCGEFFGCCVLAVACGGRLCGGGSSGASSSRLAHDPRRAARNFLAFWLPYIALALLLFCGSGLANVAVTWVQYPVKVIIKSSKLVPTMLLSALVGNGRSYGRREYLAALALCVGVATFSISPSHMDAPSQLVALGIVMLLLAVLGDVAALNTQQWLMQRCDVPPMSLMLRQNFTSFLLTLSVLLGTSGPTDFRAALVEEPQVLLYAAGFGVLTSVAVWANTHLLHEAGSVTQVALSTGRKGVTVLLSYLLFPKPFTRSNGIASFLVLAALCHQGSTARAARRRKRAPLALQRSTTATSCLAFVQKPADGPPSTRAPSDTSDAADLERAASEDAEDREFGAKLEDLDFGTTPMVARRVP
jgi:adenosine 3'-phospho 5'-phosphosulfate transporter B3